MMIDYAALEKQMKEEYEFLYMEVFVFNSYNCEPSELKDRIVVDIGANTGYFAIYAIQNGAKKVYCFEPNKKNFARLVERTKDFDNIIAINKAVHRSGVKKCYLINDNDPSLSIEENGVRTEVRINESGEGDVDCISLKEIIDGIKENVILKTDSEGSEYDFFLSSSKETFQKIDLIFSEIHNNLHPNPNYNVDMLTEFIVSNGFDNIPCVCRWTTGSWAEDGKFIPGWKIGENGSHNYYRKFLRKKITLPLVSIIIPTYKRYDLLCNAMDSVLAQTYNGNINVLVVADGNDSIVEKMMNDYDMRRENIRFTYYFIEHEGMLGGKPRIHGIEQLTADGYVCFLDDDNQLLPSYVEKMIEGTEQGKNDVIICNVLLKEDGEIKTIPFGNEIPKLGDIDSLNFMVSNKLAKLFKHNWIHKGFPVTHDYNFIKECLHNSSGWNHIKMILAEHNYTDFGFIEEPPKSDSDKMLERMKVEDNVVYEEIFKWNMYQCTGEELKDSVVIDIGANKGYFAIFAVMHGAKMVYCYEPNKEAFKKLYENVKQFKNIIPINCAVHRPDVTSVYSIGHDINSTVVIGENENSVECTSLEQIVKQNTPNENLILKIDCEGSEYDIIFSTSGESIRKFNVIYAEFHNELHSNPAYNFEMMNKFVESIGYNRFKSPVQTFVGHHAPDGTFIPTTRKDTTETSKFIRVEKEKVIAPKIYDCFPFFNELDLLEIRLEELYNSVDKFVITEANATHSGKPKPLYLTENLKRFEKYNDKIVLRVVDLLSGLPPSGMDANWTREHIQRGDAMNYLRDVCNENDLIIVSDADEIPSRNGIEQFIVSEKNSVGVLSQSRFMYYLNYKNVTTDEPQLNSKIVRYGLLKERNFLDLNAVRYCDKENLLPNYRIDNGGWHFTFMGGVEKVIEKVKAFAHQEYNVPEKINQERMMKNFEQGKDVYDAKTTWETVQIDESFPQKVRDDRQKYVDKGWIKSEKTIFDTSMEKEKKEIPEKEKGKEILCSISTKGRYDTTLSMAIMSVILQTKLPDELIIYDDNDQPKDLREVQHYHYLFRTLDEKGIKWQFIFGQKRGQHFNHQHANKSGYKFVWRLDDDTVAEPDVLEKLYALIKDDETVGAVGGSVLTPPFQKEIKATGKIENIRSEPNLQWDYIKETMEVDHLHCSFIYRAGIENYNLDLGKVAHREETLFSYGLKKKGYKILLTPCVTWHYKNNIGGIRSNDNVSLYEHDEKIFESFLNLWDVKATENKMCVLDCGMGDHYAFKNILPELRKKYKKITLAVCFPDVFFDEPDIELISIAQAKNMMNIDPYHIYRKMDEWKWNKSLVDAFRKLYLS